jgi:hypothetical protein
MLLSNGLEAHFPPHLSSEVLSAVKMGDAVTLYGVKPKSVEMIACGGPCPAPSYTGFSACRERRGTESLPNNGHRSQSLGFLAGAT